jgi:hypothetical protein
LKRRLCRFRELMESCVDEEEVLKEALISEERRADVVIYVSCSKFWKGLFAVM